MPTGPHQSAASFIHSVTSSMLYRPDGTVEHTRDPAIWTLAHRGYSGGGRLDVWAYPSHTAALRAGALLAMDCGLDEDARARQLMRQRDNQAVMDRYEQLRPDNHVLCVQAAFLQWPDDSDTGEERG